MRNLQLTVTAQGAICFFSVNTFGKEKSSELLVTAIEGSIGKQGPKQGYTLVGKLFGGNISIKIG